LSASASFATELVVAGLHLEQLTTAPIPANFEAVRIEVLVEVIGKIAVEWLEHVSILADRGLCEMEQ